jgi:hypothetical protein
MARYVLLHNLYVLFVSFICLQYIYIQSLEFVIIRINNIKQENAQISWLFVFHYAMCATNRHHIVLGSKYDASLSQ